MTSFVFRGGVLSPGFLWGVLVGGTALSLSIGLHLSNKMAICGKHQFDPPATNPRESEYLRVMQIWKNQNIAAW